MSKRKFVPAEDSPENSDKKQKLDVELEEEGLRVIRVPSDGNCLFTAIERQTGSRCLRKSAVEYMRENPELFADYMDDRDALENYINRMSLDRSWAGDMEILALANWLDADIYVYNIDGTYRIIGPSSGSGSINIRILYNNYHFDAIVPNDFRERGANRFSDIVDLVDDEDEIEENSNGMTLSEQKTKEVEENKNRLEKKEGYIFREIEPDGNCLFRAIAEQIEGYNQEDHELLRELAVEYLRQNANDFLGLQRHDSMEEAIEHMATLTNWGGIFELQVLADFLERDIQVHGLEPCFVISRTKTITKDNIIDFEVFFDGSHFSAVLRPGFIPVNIASGESSTTSNVGADVNNDDLVENSTTFNQETASNSSVTNSLMSLNSADEDSSSILGGIGLVMLRPFLTQDQIDLLFDM